VEGTLVDPVVVAAVFIRDSVLSACRDKMNTTLVLKAGGTLIIREVSKACKGSTARVNNKCKILVLRVKMFAACVKEPSMLAMVWALAEAGALID